MLPKQKLLKISLFAPAPAPTLRCKQPRVQL